MAEYKDTTKLAKEIADFKKTCNSPNSDYLTGYLSALSVTEGIIANIPTADVVEVRHGKWLTYYADCCECSLCQTVYVPQMRKVNYCPNCGAKMDGKGGAE